jgi:integrase
MPLTVTRRKSRGNALTISGTVAGIRVQRRAATDDLTLAQEEAAALEAEILRTAWHGERRGSRSFDEALISYLEAKSRHENTLRRLRRLRAAIGNVSLAKIDQDTVTRLKVTMLPAGVGPSTVTREIITPLRAVLRHAYRRGWSHEPLLEAPPAPQGRTSYMLPSEAERLVAAAASHLRPLLLFLLGTGARLAEAIYLDWRDVDLAGARAIFWPDRTKSRRRRNVALPPRVVAALAALPHREGPTFLTDRGKPYADRGGEYGGQIKTGWRLALQRAGLPREFTPHTCRHTWASWHYARHKDTLALMVEGGWSSVTLVERYAHLLPAGHVGAIEQFLGLACDQGVTIAAPDCSN